jgi:predicted RND superfamily exporter protein
VEPKQRFRWLFPDARHALVLVRPRTGISGSDMLELGRRIRAVTGDARIAGAELRVAGLPLLAASLERQTRLEILRLAPIAVAVMLLLLLVVLRGRRGRLVALALSLGSVGLCLALSWPLGLGLTVSTVAALPVVLGLGLDFAVQLQARYWIERGRGHAAPVAAARARDALRPTLLLAAVAMAAGFLVLLAGPVPLIDRLGAVLAVGCLSAVAVALLVGPALLLLTDRGPARPLALPHAGRLTRFAPPPAALAAAALLAVGGIALSNHVHLQSDISQLAPKGLDELRSTQAVQKEIGTSGQISVSVRARDVTAPAVLTWLGKAGARAQAVDRRLRPGPDLASLVSGGDPTAVPDRAGVDGMLRLLPRYFLSAVVAQDHRLAELTYAIPFVSVAEQGRIVRRIDAVLADPPPGVQARTAGLVAESATSTRRLDASRPWLLLLAAATVGLVLFAVWRDARRVALVLAPAMLAAGLSSLVLALLGVTLSPLAAALEPLVLAIGLEFGMLLDMSFRQARADGHSPTAARAVATRDIGGAVGLSAATVAAGFAVLGASRLPLLAQLGWLVAAELVLCLLVAVVVVPLVSEWLELPAGAGRRRRPTLPVVRIPRTRRVPR